MTLLHLDIDGTGQGIFSPDSPSPHFLEAVRSVVWFKDEAVSVGNGRVAASARNMLMFLSDVRGRKFKRGIFLGDDILLLAETFRSAARAVAAGQFLPDLEERPDGFHAVWRPVQSATSNPQSSISNRLLDLLARRAGRSPLEGDAGRHETVHDAWLAALRSDSGLLRWPASLCANCVRGAPHWPSPPPTAPPSHSRSFRPTPRRLHGA